MAEKFATKFLKALDKAASEAPPAIGPKNRIHPDLKKLFEPKDTGNITTRRNPRYGVPVEAWRKVGQRCQNALPKKTLEKLRELAKEQDRVIAELNATAALNPDATGYRQIVKESELVRKGEPPTHSDTEEKQRRETRIAACKTVLNNLTHEAAELIKPLWPAALEACEALINEEFLAERARLASFGLRYDREDASELIVVLGAVRQGIRGRIQNNSAGGTGYGWFSIRKLPNDLIEI